MIGRGRRRGDVRLVSGQLVADAVVDVPECPKQCDEEGVAERAVERFVEGTVFLREGLAAGGARFHPRHEAVEFGQLLLGARFGDPLDEDRFQRLAQLKELADGADVLVEVDPDAEGEAVDQLLHVELPY